MGLNWNFQRGGGNQTKKPSMGGVWIFSGTTQCNFYTKSTTPPKQEISQFQNTSKNSLVMLCTIMHCQTFLSFLPLDLLVKFEREATSKIVDKRTSWYCNINILFSSHLLASRLACISGSFVGINTCASRAMK